VSINPTLEVVAEIESTQTGESDVINSAMKIQPNDACIYLIVMLIGGLISLFMNGSTLAMLLLQGVPGIHGEFSMNFETVLTASLIILVAFDIIQLPFRTYLFINFIDSFTSNNLEYSLRKMSDTTKSWVWAANREIGNVQHILVILSLVAFEVFRFFGPSSYASSLMDAISASNIISLFLRITAALVFSIKSADPVAILEAKKRGISSDDLQNMPEIQFISSSCEVKDCSICLGSFEENDTLVVLPCDTRHRFHSNCIKTWLSRHNSCPFCQKLIL
jgi:hypothetical protein